VIHIRPHTLRDYAILPDIDSLGMGTLNEGDLACLEEIGELLIAKGANSRFGITLLHSHFPIGDNETLVEQASAGERAFTVRPVADRADSSDDYVAINLQFDADRNDGILPMIGLEFIRSEALSDIAPVSASDASVLRDVREVLERRNYLQRFGVCLLHDTIDLKKSEMLLETCDLFTRTLHCVAAGREDQRISIGVETTWLWSTPAEAARCLRECHKTCISLHCKRTQ